MNDKHTTEKYQRPIFFKLIVGLSGIIASLLGDYSINIQLFFFLGGLLQLIGLLAQYLEYRQPRLAKTLNIMVAICFISALFLIILQWFKIELW